MNENKRAPVKRKNNAHRNNALKLNNSNLKDYKNK